MAKDDRAEIKKAIKRMKTDGKIIKKVKRLLFIAIILIIISLSGMIYLTYLQY